MRGKINNVIKRKGYLFIEDEEGVSRFVLARHLKRCLDFDHLTIGQKVVFTPYTDAEADQNGERGKNVHAEGCAC
jgi:cold shock CspA family protein